MSQVKNILKMQDGKKVPDQQKKYGHLWIDGIDYGNSADVYNAFAQYARTQNLEQGEFYDQWLKALRSGQDVVFGNGNTVNMKPEDMTARRAGKRSGWTKFWDDTFNTRRNQFSDAVATARRFTFTPQEKVETPKSKKDFDTSIITLNYNPDPKNKKKQVWSNTHADNQRAIQRVSDALAWMLNPDASDYNPNEKIAAAYKIAGSTKDAEGNPITPEVFAENIWNVLRNYTGKDFTDPEVQNALDWLDAFGIVASPSTTPASTTPTGGSVPSNVPASAVPVNGGSSASVVVGGSNGSGNDGSSNDTPITVITESNVPEKPTLITPELAIQLGLDPSYNYGLIYGTDKDGNPKYYRPTGIPGNLVDTMRKVTAINNQSLPQSQRYAALSELINIPGIENYADWSPGSTFENVDLDSIFRSLGISSAAMTYGKDYLTQDGSRVYKYFDNTKAGSNPWNFRSPQWLIFDPQNNWFSNFDDTMEKSGNETWMKPQFIQNEILWGNNTVKRPSYRGNGGEYQVLNTFTHDESPMGNTPVELLIDKNGNYFIYHLPKNGLGLSWRGKVAKVPKWYADIVLIRKPKYTETATAMREGTYGKDRLKTGGKINQSKINKLVAKNGGIIKSGDGEKLERPKKIIRKGNKWAPHWAEMDMVERPIYIWSEGEIPEEMLPQEEYDALMQQRADVQSQTPPVGQNTVTVDIVDNSPKTNTGSSPNIIRIDNSKNDYLKKLHFLQNLMNPNRLVYESFAQNSSKSNDNYVNTNGLENGGKIVKAQPGVKFDSTFKPKTIEQMIAEMQLSELDKARNPQNTAFVGDIFEPLKTNADVQREQLSNTAFNGNASDKFNAFVDKYKTSDGIVEDEFSDPNLDSSQFWKKAIEGSLAALDYGSMAWGRKKVHDQVEQGLKDSLYKKVTPKLHGISTATPYEDAAVTRYDQYIQRGLTTPLTSDAITNSTMMHDMQARALSGRDQAVRTQSQAALQRQMQNQQIANQQAQLDANDENDFRQRYAGMKMNLAQNDASLTAQTAQSIQNLAREWRTKYDAETNKFNQLAYNTELTNATRDLDSKWLQSVQQQHPDLWTEWNGVDKTKYTDFYDWATNNNKWNDALDKLYRTTYTDPLTKKTLDLYKQYNLSHWLRGLYRTREGLPSRKSGGKLTIKPRNRYKNEPSEDIWINQNKATHKLVAKLNDNIIKTFLKTLK